MRDVWRFKGRMTNPDTGEDHCPGGCYLFGQDDKPGSMHVPINMFWGKSPWSWWAEKKETSG